MASPITLKSLSSKQAKMVIPAKLTSLPNELITIIVELVYQALFDDFCDWQASLDDGDFKINFRNGILLAIVHTSARIRAVALQMPKIWRYIGTIVAASEGPKGPKSALLLSLCEEDSRHTLDVLDLRRLCHFHCKEHSNSASLTMEMCLDSSIATAVKSAATLKSLRLKLFPSAEDSTASGFFDLLSKAHNLEYLDFECYGLPPLQPLGRQVAELEAAPETLDLALSLQHEPPDLLQVFFYGLTARAKKLGLRCSPADTTDSVGDLDRSELFIDCLIKPACSTLRELRLRIMTSHLNFDTLLSLDLPLLEELSVTFLDFAEINLAPNMGIKWRLPSIVSVEAPASLLSYFTAPSLRAVAATCLRDDNYEHCMTLLRSSPRVNDLVLQSESEKGTVAIATIVHMFMKDDESVVCPRLKRLSITSQPVDDLDDKWILPTAFLDPTKPENLNFRRRFTCANRCCRTPEVLNELTDMLWYREEYGLEDFDAQLDEESQSDGCCKLEMIRILDCIVKDSVWTKVKAVTSCKTLWCVADPVVFPRRSRRLADREQE